MTKLAVATGNLKLTKQGYLDGELTVQQAGEQIFQRIIAVASGERTMSEEHGMGEDEFAPWILGPTM